MMQFITDYLSKKTESANSGFPMNSGEYEELLRTIPLSDGISKNIFQICLREEGACSSDVFASLPASFRKNIEFIENNNPGYQYKLFSNQEAADFISTEFGPVILSYYNRIDKHYPAARADLLRYLLLYACGGIYLDLKSTFNQPLSTVLHENDQFLVFYWDNLSNGQHHFLIPDYIPKGEMLQGFIISAKGHPFIRKVILNVLKKIDSYNPYVDGVGWTGVLKTTGPAIYTETVFKAIQPESASAFFREDYPFRNFGYTVSFVGDYAPGHYQKQLSLRDYRKCSRPLIPCRSSFLQFFNVFWLSVLALYRRFFAKNQ